MKGLSVMRQLNAFLWLNFKNNFLLFLIFSFFTLNLYAYDQKMPDSTIVRIKVFSALKSINLGSTSPYVITLVSSNKLIKQGFFLATTKIEKEAFKGFKIGDEYYQDNALLVSTNAGVVFVNDRRFRGEIKIIWNEVDKGFDIINNVSVHDYLKGVLCLEISPGWHIEAIKAQAIVARTYAYNKIEKPVSPDYDMTADVYSQMYGGVYAEDPRTTLAVDQTAGMVMSKNGKIIPVFYFSTCGGYTEDSTAIWDVVSPCLKAVKCNYCKKASNYHWIFHIDLDTISKNLETFPGSFKGVGISAINILDTSISGRVKWMEVVYKNGKSIKMSGNTFRIKVDPTDLKSTKFDVKISGNECIFEGYGWGHGVGLCQWGAKHLAEDENYTAQEILKFYFNNPEFIIEK